MFHMRQFEWQGSCVGDKFLRRENRDDYRSQMYAAGKQNKHNRGLQPSETGTLKSGLDDHCARSQQHGIDWREVIVFPMQGEEYCVADQITPSQHAVRLESRR